MQHRTSCGLPWGRNFGSNNILLFLGFLNVVRSGVRIDQFVKVDRISEVPSATMQYSPHRRVVHGLQIGYCV